MFLHNFVQYLQGALNEAGVDAAIARADAPALKRRVQSPVDPAPKKRSIRKPVASILEEEDGQEWTIFESANLGQMLTVGPSVSLALSISTGPTGM